MSAAVKNSFQDYDPRHRLTGAIVLILMAIILLPMLLSKKPEVEESAPAEKPIVMEVTKEGNKVFVSRITAADAEPQSSDAPQKTSKPVTSKAAAEDIADTEKPAQSNSKAATEKPTSALFKPMATKQKPSADPVKTDKTAKSQNSTPKAEQSTKPVNVKNSSASTIPESGWMLQVGVFSQSANADKKVAELKKKGFDAKASKVKGSKGVVTKVWIGPFSDRNSAEKMQERLQHKTRQRGIVVENKPQ